MAEVINGGVERIRPHISQSSGGFAYVRLSTYGGTYIGVV